jgi:hypothetical protein
MSWETFYNPPITEYYYQITPLQTPVLTPISTPFDVQTKMEEHSKSELKSDSKSDSKFNSLIRIINQLRAEYKYTLNTQRESEKYRILYYYQLTNILSAIRWDLKNLANNFPKLQTNILNFEQEILNNISLNASVELLKFEFDFERYGIEISDIVYKYFSILYLRDYGSTNHQQNFYHFRRFCILFSIKIYRQKFKEILQTPDIIDAAWNKYLPRYIITNDKFTNYLDESKSSLEKRIKTYRTKYHKFCGNYIYIRRNRNY